jgi:hypothetical protein
MVLPSTAVSTSHVRRCGCGAALAEPCSLAGGPGVLAGGGELALDGPLPLLPTTRTAALVATSTATAVSTHGA